MRAALSLLLLATIPPALPAQGTILPRCRADQRCLPIPGGGVVRVASDIRVRLDDRVLHYEIEETFVNRGPALGEADYLFPLPAGAAFRELQLEIDGEMVAGETMDAAEARRVYEEIVRRQRDPALVEWMGHGLLRTRIFPIPAGSRKRVLVRYDMVAPREGDALRVDYFRGARTAAAAPDAAPRGGVAAREGRASFVLSYPSSGGLGRAWSPTHALHLEERGGRRIAEIRGDARDLTVLIPIRRGAEAAITALAHAPGGEDGFVLITLSPPAAAARSLPRDVTFVLDVSGSMRGAKMEQAREAGRQLLATLRPEDRFRIIDFASAVHSFRDGWSAATRANIRAAGEYLESLQASGGTNIEAALRAIGRERFGNGEPGIGNRGHREGVGDEDRDRGQIPLILVVTDGEPTVGERDAGELAALMARVRGEARVFTFGLGADVNVALMEQMALQGRGAAQFVRPDESVERMVGIVASRLTSPVASGVRLRATGVRLRSVMPEGPYDLFAGQDLTVLARYEGSGVAELRFEGMAGGRRVAWESQVRLPERTRENAFVPRLWATQRVGWLSAEKRAHGASAEIDEEIRMLGERYGIPTEFTSYFVKEPGMTVASGSANDVRVRRDLARQQGNASPPPAAAPVAARERRFEAARDAAAQRKAVSLQAVDELSAASAEGATTRTAANRTFTLRDSVWTDGVARDGAATIAVAPFSPAYFALLERIPELREVFALGDRVRVAGRAVVVETRAGGARTLGDDELRRIAAAW